MEVLGVPGALDGLSHVVSDEVLKRRGGGGDDIRRSVPAAYSFCHFVNSVATTCSIWATTISRSDSICG